MPGNKRSAHHANEREHDQEEMQERACLRSVGEECKTGNPFKDEHDARNEAEAQ
jgi:hypothetical protein